MKITNLTREQLMMAGLFLSKFGKEGLRCLGFSNFTEAFNAIGYASGGKPTSVKNYMQEFDPYFPNNRKGWHKRPLREHCRIALDNYNSLSIEQFSNLIIELFFKNKLPNVLSEIKPLNEEDLISEQFCKRLITGAAAETFFWNNYNSIAELEQHTITDFRSYGCGFDFKADSSYGTPFVAIEVKGVYNADGDIMLTQKEHDVAEYLKERYMLCVVSNFRDKPIMNYYINPLDSELIFKTRLRKTYTKNWHCNFRV
jgi:hypothetical protein